MLQEPGYVPQIHAVQPFYTSHSTACPRSCAKNLVLIRSPLGLQPCFLQQARGFHATRSPYRSASSTTSLSRDLHRPWRRQHPYGHSGYCAAFAHGSSPVRLPGTTREGLPTCYICYRKIGAFCCLLFLIKWKKDVLKNEGEPPGLLPKPCSAEAEGPAAHT